MPNNQIHSTNFDKGLLAQDLVLNHMENLGFSLICQNFQFYFGRKMGEIDLIMQKDKRLHLIEVKMRKSKNSKFGQIQDQITKTKLLTLAKSWQFFILKNPEFKNYFCQFDAAFVWSSEQETAKTSNLDKNLNLSQGLINPSLEITTNSSKMEIEIIFNAYQFDF